MKPLQIIDFAITETLIAHPEFSKSINYTVFGNIVDENGIQFINFTSQNDARKLMRTVTQKDMLEFILIELVKNYNAMRFFYHNNEEIRKLPTKHERLEYLKEIFPNFSTIQNAIYTIANPKINSIIYYQARPKDLLTIVDAVIEDKYQRTPVYRKYIEKFGIGETYLSNYGKQDLFAKISDDRRKTEVANKVQVNRRTVTKCLREVMSGSQLKNQRNEYGINGTLFASQDIGKKRKNQEDSVLILIHPKNPEFKFLVVSDGMGGHDLGEKASQYTVQELATWFNELPEDSYYYPLELQEALNKKIAEISQNIYMTYNEPYRSLQTGATLASAIVTEDKTIVSCIGDSRVYTIYQGQLKLLSRDESLVWPYYKNQAKVTIEEIDDLRFNKNNNLIMRCMGDEITAKSVQTLITPNNSYDRLLLFSDGVTDLLSHERIRIISSQQPPELVTKMLVDEAITHDAIRAKGEDEQYNGKISAGKDNASAAMYARR